MSKKDLSLIPGVGLGGSPILPRATTPAAATAVGGASSVGGIQRPSEVPGGVADLQVGAKLTAAQAIRGRGYARRSVNLYLQKCKSILDELELEEEGSPQLILLCQENFQKLKGAFDKFDSENEKLLSTSDVTNAQVAEAESLLEDLFTEVSTLETAILKRVGSLTPSQALTRLGKVTTDPFEDPASLVREPEEKPQFRFRGPPKHEKEEERGLQIMMRAMTVNYKPNEHIAVFEGDPFQYTSFRTSLEIADRNMTEFRYTPYEKFLELKKTLKGEPFRLIATLPNLDSSYEAALSLLDRFYLNPQNSIKKVTDSLNNLPKMTNSVESIKSFYQELVSITHAFKALNMIESDMGKSLLFNSITPKLSPACCREFLKLTQIKRNFQSPIGHDVTISDLMECILFQLQLAQQMKEVNSGTEKAKNQGAEQHKQTSHFKTFKVTEQKGGKSCHICKKNNHETKDCFLLKNLSTKDLFDKISSLNLCKLCFWPHKTKDCKFAQQNLCKTCKKRHNTLLHLKPEEIKQKFKNPPKAKHETSGNTKLVKFTASRAAEAIPHVIKARLISTNAKDPKSMIVNVLFDTGSSINLVRKEIAEKLQLETHKSRDFVEGQAAVGVGNVPLEIDLSRKISFTLSPVIGPNYQSPKIEGFATEVIDSELGGLDFDPKTCKHLKNIELSMAMPHQPITVDVLLGEPWVSFLTISAPIKDLNLKEPHVVAIKTKLGTFLGGSNRPLKGPGIRKVTTVTTIPSVVTTIPSMVTTIPSMVTTIPSNGINPDQSGHPESGLSSVV